MFRIGMLSVTAVFCILLATVQGVAAQAPECLQFDDQFTNRVVMNPATGTNSGGETTAAINATVEGTSNPPRIQISPDEKHVAIQYKTSDAKIVFGLMPAYTIDAPLDLTNAANDGFGHFEVNWSPDSQWLSYISDRGDDGYFLSVMDAAGQTKQEHLISLRHEDWISSFGWSADGRYLAISVSDGVDRPLRKIEIWSMPDLKLARLIKPEDSKDSPRSVGQSSNFDRIQWSPDGHWLAHLNHLVNGMFDGFILNLYSPDDDKVTTYDLRYLTNKHAISISWSPNGHSIALVSFIYDYENFGRIDMFEADGSAPQTVSDVVLNFRYLTDGGIGYPLTYWSPDGHALLFVEALPSKSHNVGTLMAYIPDTKQKVMVHPHLYMNPGTQANNRYLFAFSPNDGQDHNQYLNHEAEPANNSENTIAVIDTNTFDVISVPPLHDRAGMLQTYGTKLDQSGWLFLAEDDLTTWAINLKTGAKLPIYDPDSLVSKPNNPLIYIPSSSSEFVVKEEPESGSRVTVSITSLKDQSTRKIAHPFNAFMLTVAVSANGDLFAAIVRDPNNQQLRFEVYKTNGSELGQFDLNSGSEVHHLMFTSCE